MDTADRGYCPGGKEKLEGTTYRLLQEGPANRSISLSTNRERTVASAAVCPPDDALCNYQLKEISSGKSLHFPRGDFNASLRNLDFTTVFHLFVYNIKI